ncbi:MAG: hypothetical protein IJT16_04170 [Lachnospiraceae bacterium]|nr:hypothetical protein [Lachnospiraceae bacterium]
MGSEERYIELYFPQLCKSLDLMVPKDTLTGRLSEAALSELGLLNVECIMLSCVLEKLLAPLRTIEEEGVGSGDKLIVLYKYRKEQRNYATGDVSGGVYQDEQGYGPNGEADP